jgi:hypothetical protein
VGNVVIPAQTINNVATEIVSAKEFWECAPINALILRKI